MAVVSGALAASVQFPVVSVATVANVSLPLADTEATYTLPMGTQKFSLSLRPGSAALLRLAFSPGDSAILYKTIMPGSDYQVDGLDASSPPTIYFQTNKPGQIAEIVSWA